MAEGLLDAAIGAATSAGATAGAQLASALDALGVLVRDHAGTAGVSSEALGALRADAHAFLAPRLQPALDSAGGLLGLRGPAGGPWRLAVPGAPLELEVAAAPWRVALRSAGGLDLGAGLRLDGEIHAALPAMTVVDDRAAGARRGRAQRRQRRRGARADAGHRAAPITVVPSHEGSPRSSRVRCSTRSAPRWPRRAWKVCSARAGASGRSRPCCATRARGCARPARSATARTWTASAWTRS